MTRRLLGAALILAGALASTTARAQVLPARPGPLNPRPSFGNAPETGRGPTLSKRSYKLFDQRRGTTGFQLDIGPIWLRKTQDETPEEARTNAQRGTGEISLNTTVTTPRGLFYLTGYSRTLLRVADSKSFAWSVLGQDVAAGLRLGPLEPEVRLGVSFVTIDVFHGDWSGELLSPRVGAGFGLHLGKIRLDIKAHSEYLWRWFGPDYLIHGVTLGVRLDAPRPKKSPFVEPPR